MSIFHSQYLTSKLCDSSIRKFGIDLSRALPEDSKPILLPEKFAIARRPNKIADELLTNGHTNGNIPHINGTSSKRKREVDEPEIDQVQLLKRGKVRELASKEDDLVVLDDPTNGAIVIDDD